MRYGLTVVLVVVLSLAAAVARADDPVQLASGTRVRVTVTTGGGHLVGRVLALDDTNLTLLVSSKPASSLQVSDTTTTKVLRREEITQLAVSEGVGSRARGAFVGAGIAAGTGALIGLTGGNDDAGSLVRFSAGEKALLVALMLAPIGAVIGALHPTERWEDLPKDRIHLGFAPVGKRGAAVSLAFTF